MAGDGIDIVFAGAYLWFSVVNDFQSRVFDMPLGIIVVLCAAAGAMTWVESEWAKTAVGVGGALAICSAIYGGKWRGGAIAGSVGTFFAFLFDVGGGGFPHSPGLVAWAACGAAAGAFLTVGVFRPEYGPRRLVACLCFALFLGSAAASLIRPGGQGIQRPDIAEGWDGVLVANRHLLFYREDGHDLWRLELPGSSGVPWSIGHALLFSGVGGATGVLMPGASFLPVRPDGKPAPFWTYLGGGGEHVTPVSTMRTTGLMGRGGI